MRINHLDKFLTLDWDGISINEAKKRCEYILANYTNIRKLVLRFSPVKGFHVWVYLYGNTNVARMRKELKDDGNRLVHDLLNRPNSIHDVLWDRKTIDGVVWKAETLNIYEVINSHGK